MEKYLRRESGEVQVKDMMTTGVPVLSRGDTIRQVVEFLRNSRLDGLPVVGSDNRLLGIFTRVNLFNAFLDGCSLSDDIEAFYARRVVTVRPETPFYELSKWVKISPVGMGVVVDEEEHVLGVFTKVDMIMALFRQSDLLNARLQAVYSAMYNAIVSFDAEGRITLLNPAAERMLEKKECQVIGRDIEEVFPGLDLEPVIRGGGLEIGKKYDFAGRALMVNSTPIVNGVQLAGAIAVFQDLTEIEQVAAELESVKKLHHTLETVLEIAYDGIVVVDGDGIVTLMNKSMSEFFDISPVEAMGKHVTEVLENTRLHIVAKTGVPEYSEVQEIRGNLFVVSRLPILENGRVVGAVGKVMFRRLEEARELAKRLDTLEDQLARYREELSRAGRKRYTFEDIVTVNPAMIRLKKEALQASRGNSTILVYGESGTGKELFAQAIHTASRRREGPFITINCAAMPENLLESEFFGYAPGAFTGASKSGKPGRFELAQGGTIFLDEVGDMSPALQAKLLRVLQDREFERIGGTRSIQVDVRIIAATNCDLEKMVAEGVFRADLYYRLNVISLRIPSLRERIDDILPLVERFLGKYNAIFGTDVRNISSEALCLFKCHQWPGNVRELENVVERAINFARGKAIEVTDLPEYLKTCEVRPKDIKGYSMVSYRERMRDAESDAITAAIIAAGGNKTKAALMLGISRSRLYEKLKRNACSKGVGKK